jgi:hypothetical protein
MVTGSTGKTSPINVTVGRPLRPPRGACTVLGFAAGVFQHGASKHVLCLGMGRHAEAGNVDADDSDAVDCFRQQLQRNAGRRRHTQVRDDDGVVEFGVSELVNRLADILEQLASDQSLGIERHVADGAARAVEVRGEGESIDAARRAAQHRRRPPHPQPDAQRAESGAHALRLVMGADRIVYRIAVEGLALSGGRGGLAQLLLPAMATATFARMRRDLQRPDGDDSRVLCPGSDGGRDRVKAGGRGRNGAPLVRADRDIRHLIHSGAPAGQAIKQPRK